MNKKNLLILLLIIAIPSVIAISTDMRSAYSQGETLIITISGNFLEPISNENIAFMHGHVQVPFEYDLKKIEGNYYLWAIAPAAEDNYTLLIRGITTAVLGKIEKIDFMQNFSTLENLTDYSIKPGAIYASNDFEITINLNTDDKKDISINFPSQREVSLSPGENKIKFNIQDFNDSGFITISLGKYNIPAFIIKNNSGTELAPPFRFVPRTISSTTLREENKQYPFSIINNGPEGIEALHFEYNTDLFSISPEEASLKADETAYFNLSIKDTSQNIDENIFVIFNNISIALPVKINFTDNTSEVKTPYLESGYNPNKEFYCGELSGKLCSAGDVCSVATIVAKDGNCCTGTCSIKKESSGLSWLGYLIGAFVLIGLIYLGLRYYSVKAPKNPLDKKVAQAERKL